MIRKAKKIAFKTLGIKNYLRLMQIGFSFAYRTGILKNSESYKYHYYAKDLINEGDVVIDIGANLGYYSKLFSKWVGNSGKVYSVEPITVFNDVFNRYTRKCHNITLMPYALGLDEKEITLVTSTRSGYFNTGLPHVYDSDRDGNFEAQEFKFKAQMKIPSKLFADIDRINYIKCDIEGFEYIVLSDMKDIIAQRRPIVQVEIWGQNEQLILSMFNEIGYIAYKLGSGKLISDKELISRTEGDYIFMPSEVRHNKTSDLAYKKACKLNLSGFLLWVMFLR